MARKASKKSVEIEIEDEAEDPSVSPDEREERESFKGAEPAFSELKRAPEIETAEANAEAAEKHRRVMHRQVLDFLEEFRKGTVNLVFAGIIGLLIWTFVKVINADELSIDPVTLPKAIHDLGYSEDGVALALSDNMFKIFDEVRISQHTFNVKAKIDEGDFAVPVAGLSFTSAIRLARQLAGFPQRHISGELICPSEPCTPATMELHLRLMDGVHPPQVLETIKGGNAEEILKIAAEKLLRIADPVSLAVYYFDTGKGENSRRPEALAIAKEMLLTKGPDRAVALNILAADIEDRSVGNDELFGKAAAFFEMAIAENPDYAPSYSNLAALLVTRGHYADGIENFKKAIKLDDASVLHRDLARAYFENGQYDLAQPEFEIALQMNPQDHESANGLGAILFQAGKNVEAIAQYTKAIEINPDFPETYFNMGLAQQKADKTDAARASFEACLRLAAEGSLLKSNAQKKLDEINHVQAN